MLKFACKNHNSHNPNFNLKTQDRELVVTTNIIVTTTCTSMSDPKQNYTRKMYIRYMLHSEKHY